MRFVSARPAITIAGFVADANPNVTAPTDDKVYSLADRGQQGNEYSVGIGLTATFVKTSPPGTFEDDVATASIVFVLWIFDSNSGGWIRLTSDTAIHRLYKVSADVRGASKLFVQVTAINNVAAATSVNVRLREV